MTELRLEAQTQEAQTQDEGLVFATAYFPTNDGVGTRHDHFLVPVSCIGEDYEMASPEAFGEYLAEGCLPEVSEAHAGNPLVPRYEKVAMESNMAARLGVMVALPKAQKG